MFYAYFIKSIIFPDKKYIGHTDNLKELLATHDSGGSIYTKDHRPWKLHMVMGFEDKLKATDFEKYLKSVAGRVFAKKRFWWIMNY